MAMILYADIDDIYYLQVVDDVVMNRNTVAVNASLSVSG